MTYGGSYEDSIKTMLRHFDEATGAKPKAYSADDRQRDIEDVIKAYNSMVEQSNNVGYTTAMK